MLYDAVDDAGNRSPSAIHGAYVEELAGVVEDLGVDAVEGGTGLDRGTVERLAGGDAVDLTLGEAAEVLALADGAPDADDIAWEVRDHLLMGMTTGILDVDTVASELETDLDGTEVQQMLEGRRPMTLSQLAALHGFIASKQG